MFDNADLRLFPNQFVNIRLLVDTLQNQTVVPVAAVPVKAPLQAAQALQRSQATRGYGRSVAERCASF